MTISKKYLILGAAFAALAAAQDNAPQRITVPFRDPAAPRKLEVNLPMSNVTVRGSERADAVIDYTLRGPGAARRNGEAPPPGMHRIGGTGTLDVAQENNVIRVSGGGFVSGPGDVAIQVPAQTAVTIASALGGKILVENIAGEIEISNLNGEITISNASGPVVAHSMNGNIVASLSKLTPDKSMSFSTFNGNVDVTLPADSKATLKATADNGDVFTDFDVKIEPRTAATPAPPAPPLPPAPPSSGPDRLKQAEDRAKQAEKRAIDRQKADEKRKGRVSGDGYVEGTINGGGTEIQFTTFNGRILIHKK